MQAKKALEVELDDLLAVCFVTLHHVGTLSAYPSFATLRILFQMVDTY